MKKSTEEKEPFELEDSVTAGLLKAKAATSPGLSVVPFRNENGKVIYRITGDVQKALAEIYENRPVGALDALQGIRFCRAAIFALRGGQRQ